MSINVYSIVSAILFAACFPGTPFSIVIFVIVSPFFISLSKTSNLKTSFIQGCIFGALYSLIVAYWIFNALYFHYEVNIFFSVLFLLIFVVLPVSILYGVFAISFRLFFKNSMFFFVCVVPSLWIIFDYVRALLPLYLPWGFAGYALSSYPILVQIADAVGVYGVTYCIVAINSLIAGAWIAVQNEKHGIFSRIQLMLRQGKKYILITISIVCMMALYGAIQINRWNDQVINKSGENLITVKVVQGSFAPQSRWNLVNVMEIFEKSIKLTGQFDEKKKYLVVWPETVINASGTLHNSIIAQIIHLLGEKNFLILGG